MWVAQLLAQSASGEAAEKLQACGPKGQQAALCSWVYDITKSEHAADVADALAKPVRLVTIILLAWVATRVVRLVIRHTVRRLADEGAQEKLAKARRRTRLSALETSLPMSNTRRAQRAATIGVALRGITSIAIWGIAFVLAMSTFDVSLGPIIAGAGFLGLALGFGMQRLVQDFTSGLFMIVEDQFGVGDVIDVGDTSGTVESLTLRVTQVRDVEGVLWHVPNGEIRRVANKSQRWSHAVLDVPVSYGSEVELTRRVILDTATALYEDPAWKGREILEPPEVWGVEAFEPDGYTVRLVVKTKPLRQWDVARELRERIKDAFDREGIEIPSPQRTVWLRSEPGTDGAAEKQESRP